MKKIINVLPATVIPLIFFLISYYLLAVKGSYFIGGSDDPDYAYLMNSLRIATLHSSFLYQHPGTTLQVFGALIIAIKYTLSSLIGSVQSLPLEVLSHTEAYLRTINITTNAVISLFMVLLGFTVYRKTKHWGIAFAFQCFPFFSEFALGFTTRVTTESFLILAMALFLLALVPFFPYASTLQTKKQLVFLGLSMAFACATKITALPILLFIFIAQGFKNKRLIISAFLIGFVIFVLPIWSRFPLYLSWMKNLVTHKGQYGGGEAGVVDVIGFLQNLVALWDVFYWLYWLAGLALVWSSYRWWVNKRNNNVSLKTDSGYCWTLILVAIVIIQTVMTAKHFRLHYMMPSLLLMSLLAVVLWIQVSEQFKNGFSWGIKLPIVVIVCFSLLNAFTGSLNKMENMRRIDQVARADALKNQQQISAIGQGCVPILYPHSGLFRAALVFGNAWSHSMFYSELRKLYPNTYVYNLFGEKNAILLNGFKQGASKQMVLNGIRQGQCFLLRGPAEFIGIQKENNILELMPLNNNAQERLYRIVSVN